MTKEAKEKYIQEYIATMRQHFATYHNHKEQMAYTVTAFYLAGISILVVNKDMPWQAIASYCRLFYITSFLAAAAMSFVWWQLHMRTIAATIVSACDSVRLQWFTQPLDHLNTSPAYYKGVGMPRFLKEEIPIVKGSPVKQQLWRIVPVALMGTWYVLLLNQLAIAHAVSNKFPILCIFD